MRKLGLDHALLTGVEQHARVGAAPKDEPDRVDQQRLTGARLARKQVEPRSEAGLDVGNQGVVLDAEAREHAMG